METNKVYKGVEDFLKDNDFIEYVLEVAHSNASYWEELLKEHAELLDIFEEARLVLLATEEKLELKLEQTEKHELKNRIFTTLKM